jgi:hypothetical protein
MILIYPSSPIDQNQIDNTIATLKDRLSPFFNDDDFIFSTETNKKLLRDAIITYKVFLFYTYSIKEIGLSPTEISELIIFLLNNGCEFQSESDDLYLTKEQIDIVYPTVFEVFRTST